MDRIDSKQKEKILHILELSKRGVGGEAINASSLLDKLLEEHGLTRQDLESTILAEEKRYYIFNFENKREKVLLTQVACYVTNSSQIRVKVFKNAKNSIKILLTRSEYEEADYLFGVYKNLMISAFEELNKKHKAEKKAFMYAFFNKHNLHTKPDVKTSSKSKGRKKSSEFYKALNDLYDQIEKVNIKKALKPNILEIE